MKEGEKMVDKHTMQLSPCNPLLYSGPSSVLWSNRNAFWCKLFMHSSHQCTSFSLSANCIMPSAIIASWHDCETVCVCICVHSSIFVLAPQTACLLIGTQNQGVREKKTPQSLDQRHFVWTKDANVSPFCLQPSQCADFGDDTMMIHRIYESQNISLASPVILRRVESRIQCI